MNTVRKIIHIDMDAFYASVEQRDEPDYRGKPLVVGGSPEKRGAVAAASYEARKFGIRSAMPSRIAVQKCPDVIFVKPRFEVYRAVSEQIREIFDRYTNLVEPLALDEAYLDVTINRSAISSATAIAKEIKQSIYAETGLTASAGVSINKFLAKVASDMDKPDGLVLIPPQAAAAFVEELPIEKFHGIGAVTAAKMHKLGITRGSDLKRWTEEDLVHQFGKVGRFYYRIVRAQDDRPVNPNRIRKSIGAEKTFEQDLTDLSLLGIELKTIAQTLKNRLDARNACGRTITLKIRYADYQLITRSRTLPLPTADEAIIFDVTRELLEATIYGSDKQVRLLGISVSNLGDEEKKELTYEQLSLEFGTRWESGE
ncbi:MAG: DNA polymerase IV [Kovacikia sp.]